MKRSWSKLTDNFDAGDESRGHDYLRHGKAVCARWADEGSALLDAGVAGCGGNADEKSIELNAEGGAAGALSAEDLKTLFEPLA